MVNPADSAALYPSLTASQLSTIDTAWSYNSPFITSYLVFDVSAATNPAQSQLLAGAVSPLGAATAASAYSLAKTSGYYNHLVIGDISAGSQVTQYAFDSSKTLIFAIPDNILFDNAAGVSVLISPLSESTAPEPGAMSLMFTGAGALYLMTRCIRRS